LEATERIKSVSLVDMRISDCPDVIVVVKHVNTNAQKEKNIFIRIMIFFIDDNFNCPKLEISAKKNNDLRQI